MHTWSSPFDGLQSTLICRLHVLLVSVTNSSIKQCHNHLYDIICMATYIKYCWLLSSLLAENKDQMEVLPWQLLCWEMSNFPPMFLLYPRLPLTHSNAYLDQTVRAYLIFCQIQTTENTLPAVSVATLNYLIVLCHHSYTSLVYCAIQLWNAGCMYYWWV